MNDPVRILIVDDDSNLRRTLSDILKVKGFEPFPCATGREALELIGREKIVAALIDLRLEDISGLEVLRGIKQHSPQTECILLTGHASQATAIEAVNLGAYSYFQKPYDLEQLLLSIRHAVEKFETAKALAESQARYYTFINATTDMAFLKDEYFRYLIVNEAAARFFGKPSAEIIGRDDFELLPAEVAQTIRQGDEQILRVDKLVISVQEMRGRIYEFREFTVDLQDGRLGVGGYIRDVTESRKAEAALRASEAQYRLLADHMSDTIWLMDMNLKTTYISPSVEKMRGYTLEELQQLPLDQNMTPASFQAAMELFAAEMPRVVADPTYVLNRTMELEFCRKAGGTFWAENKFSIIYDEYGKPVSILGEGRDITERKRAEEALSKSEAELQALFAAMPDIVVVLDKDGRYLKIAPTNPEAFYRPPDEFLGLTLGNTFPETESAMFLDQIRTALTKRQTVHLEHMVLIRNETVWFSVSISPMTEDTVVWIGRDITQRKKTEATLAAERNLLNALIDNLPDNVFAKDSDGRILVDNAAHRRVLRATSQEEVVGKTDFDFFPQELAASYYADEQEIIRTGIGLSDKEEPVIAPDGTQRWLLTTKMPLYGYRGMITGIVGVNHDITERKQAEATLAAERNLLNTLINAVPDSIFVKDAESRIVIDNIEHRRVLGATSQEEVVGKTDFDFFPQELAASYNADEQEIIHSGVALVNKEEPSVDPGGFQKWLLTTKVPLRNQQGMITGIVGISHDITERKRAEEAQQRSERLFRALFELSPDAVMLIDPYDSSGSWPIVDCNAAACLMNGYQRDELIGHSIDMINQGPGTQAERIAYVKQLREAGNLKLETHHRHKNGNLFPIEVATTFIKVGERELILGIDRDITERKQAEDALLMREAYLQAIMNNVPYLMWLKDTDGKFLAVNNSFARSCGQNKAEDVIGKTDFDIWPVDLANTYRADDAEIMATLQQKSLEEPIHDQNGTKWFETFKIPILDHAGQLIGTTGISRDISERKQAEELLHRRLAELEVLYENSLTISQMLDPRQIAETMTETLSQKLEWHHAAVRLYHPESNSIELLALHQPHADTVSMTREIERLKQTIQVGKGLSGWVIEHGETICTGDVNADPRYVETYPGIRSGVYVPMKLGKTVLGCISVESEKPAVFNEQDLRLLSTMAAQTAVALHQAQLYGQVQQYAVELEKRVAERTAELQRANLELARAARMKDEFLASMSHELRTPLTGILGLSESLQLNTYGELSEKQLKVLKNIEGSGRHLLELINDILDLSKIEAGKFDLQIEPCSLAGMCQASLQMIKGMAQQKRQQTSFAITPDSIVVRADARRLKQMLVNLLSNAVKFTPEGGALGVEARGNEREQRVRITVWDTGIGIRSEDLPRLFQPFVQLDSSLSRQYAGTGLGLSLVQRMADLHGGSVEVESVPGQGSRFTIILPWETEAAQPESPTDKITNRLHRALTIDENEINVELLTRYLEKLGLSNQALANGQGAVELAAQIAPDVILIHLHLSDKPGLELLAELKSDGRTRNIPVILMSVEEKRPEAMALGAAGYLVKPFMLADLQTELQQVAAQLSNLEPVAEAAPVILLADDNEIILEVMTDFLRTRDFQVVAVHNGNELLERVDETHPDILLIDIQMPGMDGLEVMQRIRANPDARISALPMIAITALAMSGDRERCIAAGANEYLSKPLHLEKLVETIRELCKG